ncbi:MAG TPA: hypothetical protein VF040_09885 [Ktedonobacterales bacterium]
MGKGQKDGRRQPASPRRRAQSASSRSTEEIDDFAPFASWDGEEFARIYGDPGEEPGDPRRTTLVVPAITLPSVPSVSAVKRPVADDDVAPQRALVRDVREKPEAAARGRRQNQSLMPSGKKPKVPDGVDIVLVPGSVPRRRGIGYGLRRAGQRLAGPLHVVRAHRKALSVFGLALILFGVLANTTGLLSSSSGLLSAGQWVALASLGGPPPTATPRPAPDTTNPAYYVRKYGFDYPSSPRGIPSDEFQRLAYMLPFAYQATAAYDQRYHQSIEPEMLVWWTHSEGIRGRINYSNCANYPPRAGYSYFTNIQNCPHASFWQLGYGNQFSVIYVLKNAFRDLHGDPNDPKLVQKVGQWVLDFDRRAGTYPPCGGYSCTFPARTIDSIMSGIDTTLGVQTADNWWASVLSRDPAINCYMIAHALTYFNHQATRGWIGCYYAEPCWGNESNRLGDILSAWPALRRAAHL